MGYSSTVWTSMDVAPTTQTVENKIVKKINKSARFFMEKAQEYDEMIQEADHEYKIGMRHLANMMGEDPENFSQEDANVIERRQFEFDLFLIMSIISIGCY